MKLKRILALPFALAADVVTLGNMGERSFTQQVFDAERHDQETDAVVRAIEALSGNKTSGGKGGS